MGKPLMIQEDDNRRIEQLRKKLGIKTKVQVVREALGLLERDARKLERIQRWKKAAMVVSGSSKEILSDFMPYSRLRKDE